MIEKYDYYTVKGVFERAEEKFREDNSDILNGKLSERTLCGALMISLHDVLRKTVYSEYYVDVEFNRCLSNNDNNIKCLKKIVTKAEPKRIFCDLIVHGRGKLHPDNLIALEMKKIQRNKTDAVKGLIKHDTERLEYLTSPNNKFGYVLGVYYEVNYWDKMIYIEYYHNEKNIERDSRNLSNVL